MSRLRLGQEWNNKDLCTLGLGSLSFWEEVTPNPTLEGLSKSQLSKGRVGWVVAKVTA